MQQFKLPNLWDTLALHQVSHTKPELIWIGNMKLSHFTIIMDEFLLVSLYLSQVVPYFCASNLTYQICDTLWQFGHPTYTKPELVWISNMKLSDFTIIFNEFLVVPNICPSSAIFLRNNLTYQICNTLWYFDSAIYTKPQLIWIGNMKVSHFTIIMDEFLLVPNICPSTIFVNHLTYQIWHFGHPSTQNRNWYGAIWS